MCSCAVSGYSLSTDQSSYSFNSMALYSFFSPSLLYPPSHIPRRLFCPKASLSSSSPESKASQSVSSATSTTTSPTPSVESRPPDPAFNYALTNPNGNPIVRIVRATESSIERVFLYFSVLILKPYFI